jgi:hypothetical protein
VRRRPDAPVTPAMQEEEAALMAGLVFAELVFAGK